MNKSQRNNKFTSVKVKTLNNSIFEIFADLQESICSIQGQIQQKTSVPIGAQRLLFKGLHLEATRSLKSYNVQENNVILLIANKIPSEVSQNSSLRRSQANRIKSINKEHHKYKKHMYLQQRTNGFRIPQKQVMQVLEQNKNSINELIQSINHNYAQQSIPFRLQKRKLKLGEWIDIRDISGQWAQAQVINNYNQYVLVHYNGWPDRMNEWVSASSERIMPFRSHTVQAVQSNYLSPCPKYQTTISKGENTAFQPQIQKFIGDLSITLDNFNAVLKELELQDIQHHLIQQQHDQVDHQNMQQEQEESVKNLSNNAENNQNIQINLKDIDEVELDKKQQFYTPSKEIRANDNLSNKAQDDISKGDKDDISNKSFKSKRSEGLVDTQSMKSLIIDDKKRTNNKISNKIFFDSTEAHSVRSVKNKNPQKYHYYNQEYILEESDSQINDQQENQNYLVFRKKQYQRKMKASQLAPLSDRLGRLLVDLAPQFAMLGYQDQAVNNFSQNLSTFTNQGSLQSRLAKAQLRATQEQEKCNLARNGNCQKQNYCQFQIPVMLTPAELSRLTKLLEQEKRQNNIQ